MKLLRERYLMNYFTEKRIQINTFTERKYVCKLTVFLIESSLEGTERIVPAAEQNSIISFRAEM